MKEERIDFDGFYSFKSEHVKQRVVLKKTTGLAEAIAFMRDKQITSLTITDSADGKKEPDNLDFLTSFLFVEDIIISSYNENLDLSGLYNLTKLKSLYLVQSYKFKLDLSNFQALKSFKTEYWRASYKSVFDLNKINSLSIKRYKESDLSMLKSLTKLNHLEIITGSVKSLKGIEEISTIKKLELHYVYGLNSLEFAPINIKTLIIQNLKNLMNIDSVQNISQLKFLEIISCGDITSISTLKDLRKLEHLRIVGNTKILDGEMKYLTHIPKVTFRDFNFYSHINVEGKAVVNKKRITTQHMKS